MSIRQRDYSPPGGRGGPYADGRAGAAIAKAIRDTVNYISGAYDDWDRARGAFVQQVLPRLGSAFPGYNHLIFSNHESKLLACDYACVYKYTLFPEDVVLRYVFGEYAEFIICIFKWGSFNRAGYGGWQRWGCSGYAHFEGGDNGNQYVWFYQPGEWYEEPTMEALLTLMAKGKDWTQMPWEPYNYPNSFPKAEGIMSRAEVETRAKELYKHWESGKKESPSAKSEKPLLLTVDEENKFVALD